VAVDDAVIRLAELVGPEENPHWVWPVSTPVARFEFGTEPF
jgi:hypothetical protein